MTSEIPRGRPTATVAAAAAATVVMVYSPQLLTDAGQFSRVPLVLRIGWLVLLLVLPPLVAFVVGRSVAPSGVSVWVGTPLPVLTVVLACADVRLEVWSGYLLAGSGEEAMSYGIGTTLAGVVGTVLLVLVTLTARTGAVASRRADEVNPSTSLRTSSPRHLA